MGLSTLRSGDALRLSTIPASVLSNSWIRKSGRRVWADSWVGRNRAFDRISFEGLLYDGKNPLPLCFRGTTFQSAVWQALLRIAPGETMTYAEVAAAVGCPGAVRQVALAIAANRLAVAVPCHRVVCDDGGGGGYRWGRERKKAIVDWERMAM